MVKLLTCIAATLLIAGCATTPQIPVELQYVPPVGMQQSLATLAGSQEDSTVFDNFTGYVIGVDGKRVMAGRKGWSTALPILPGPRNITVAFQRGVYSAQAALALQAATGGQYQVRFASGVQVYGANTYCDFWIVDTATQKPVTEIRRGLIGGRGQTTIPIFIPRR